MDKRIRDKIIEIAKEKGDDLEHLSARPLWEYVRTHAKDYKTFFGSLYGEGDDTQIFELALKKYCPTCEINLIDLQEFRENHPKYDNQIILTFNQDWLGGDLWHLHKIDFRKYGEE